MSPTNPNAPAPEWEGGHAVSLHDLCNEEARKNVVAGSRIPLDVSEAEILAWLKAKAASFGVAGLRIQVGQWENFPDQLYVSLRTTAKYSGWFGDTFAEAEVAMHKEIDPSPERIHDLRSQAQQLLKEAAAMEALQSP